MEIIKIWKTLDYGVSSIPLIIFGILVVLTSIYKIVKIFRTNDVSNKYINAIWLFGLLGFLCRLFEQLIYLSNVFVQISSVKDPDISLIADSLSDVMLYLSNGLAVLILSLILWGIIKALVVLRLRILNSKKNKSTSANMPA